MLKRSLFRMIKSTMGRFLAIFAIIALGVGVFVGLRVSHDSMTKTAEIYLTEQNFYDFRLVSTLGLTDDDVEAFAAEDCVLRAEGSVQADFLYKSQKGSDSVIRAHMLLDDMNVVDIVDGRMPEAADEILADARFIGSSSIGRQLVVSENNDESTLDMLRYDAYTIVGTINSPYYIHFERGTTSAGAGEMSGFCYMTPEAFDTEYYTEVFLKMADMPESGTPEYDDALEAYRPTVEALLDKRGKARYASLKDEAQEKIDDAQAEIDDGWQQIADAKAEIDDAKTQLSDAEQELADGRQELSDARSELDDGWKELSDAERKLLDGKQELADARKKLDDGWKQYYDGLAEYEDGKKAYEDGVKAYQDGVREYEDGARQVEEARRAYESGSAEYIAGLREFYARRSDGLGEIGTGRAELDAAKAELVDAERQLNDGLVILNEARAELDEGWRQLAESEGMVGSLNGYIKRRVEAEIAAGRAQLEAGEAEYAAGLAAYNANYLLYQQGLADYEAGVRAYESGLALYDSEIASAEQQLNAASAELGSGAARLAEAEQQLIDGQKELDDAKKQIEDSAKQLADAEIELQNALKELRDGEAEYAQGLRDFEDGNAEIEDARQTLADGESDYADGLQDYREGLAEYNDKKAEADETIADAEEEIRKSEGDLEEGQKKVDDAREELGKLKEATVFTLDRSTNTGYSALENDTAIVKGVAKVFPVFFFLVAALVCITTMTRMIDEQRTENGTLKALGFKDGKIIGRYLFYVGTASILGCFTGFFIGSKFMPMTIWKIYRIMYDIDRPATFILDWKQFAVCTVLYLICALGATYLVCRKDLREAAAELIRPKAPMAGKRVLLERIPFIWNRLSFLKKVSIRNIFLYKKRMIMMILGIGGCTALLMAGFGIRDSIKNMLTFQYDEISTYDAVVTTLDPVTEADRERITELCESFTDGIAFASMVPMTATGENGSEEVSVVAYREPLDGFINLHYEGKTVDWPGAGEGIISYGTASKNGVKIGDIVKLTDDEHPALSVTITGIFDNYLYDYIYTPQETFRSAWGEEADCSNAFLNFRDDADHHASAAVILSDDGVADVSLTVDMKESVGSMLESMDLVVLIVLVCAGALAFIVLYNLTNISITERKREIATLKVLGFYKKETAQYVFRENIILTAISAVFGIPMGIALLRYVMKQIVIRHVFFPCRLEPMSYVWSVVITFVFAILIDLFLHKKIDSIDMAESMKAIE